MEDRLAPALVPGEVDQTFVTALPAQVPGLNGMVGDVGYSPFNNPSIARFSSFSLFGATTEAVGS